MDISVWFEKYFFILSRKSCFLSSISAGEIEHKLAISFLKLSYDIFLFLSSNVLMMAHILSFSWPLVQMEKQHTNSLKSKPSFLLEL